MVIVSAVILLVIVASKDCPRFCEENPENCDEGCLNPSCETNWKDCVRLKECRNECKSLMGDGKCDLECNNFQCIWDGFDCGSDCAYNCKINMIGNSICDQECNNSECEWVNFF